MESDYELERKCWRKKTYSTSREAQRVIKKIYKESHLRLYKYSCSTCKQYHLTKQLSAKGKIL